MIIRVNKTKDYTVMSNHHLRDTNLTLKAKGLLSLMLSLPESWDYSISGLVAICKESETAVNTALTELKRYKYLKITKLTPDKTASKRIEYVYDIYETPYQKGDFQGIENQGVGFLPLENQPLENQGQLNTNISNTNLSNNNNKNVSPDRVFPDDDMQAAFDEWLKYKAEKGQRYKQTGLSQLIKKLNADIAVRGKATVIKGIYDSMANGWAGIYYHDTEKKQSPKKKSQDTSEPASYDINRFEDKINKTVPKLNKNKRS